MTDALPTLLSKQAFGALALVLTFAAFVPCYLTIWRGETRPHVFSWFIWGAGTVISTARPATTLEEWEAGFRFDDNGQKNDDTEVIRDALLNYWYY